MNRILFSLWILFLQRIIFWSSTEVIISNSVQPETYNSENYYTAILVYERKLDTEEMCILLSGISVRSGAS